MDEVNASDADRLLHVQYLQRLFACVDSLRNEREPPFDRICLLPLLSGSARLDILQALDPLPIRHVSLEPLSSESVRSVLDQSLPHSVINNPAVWKLLTQCQGVPALIEELVVALRGSVRCRGVRSA